MGKEQHKISETTERFREVDFRLQDLLDIADDFVYRLGSPTARGDAPKFQMINDLIRSLEPCPIYQDNFDGRWWRSCSRFHARVSSACIFFFYRLRFGGTARKLV